MNPIVERTPLTVAGLGDAAEALTVHFGPGEVVVGVTTTTDNHDATHAAIHRAALPRPGHPVLPACKHTSHGQLMEIVTALAVIAADTHSAVCRALHERDTPLCRLCRRCWPTTQIPAHNGCTRRRSQPDTRTGW